MFYKIIVTLLLLDNILPSPLGKYQIIIISKKSPDRTNYLKQPKSSRYMNSDEISDRIDIEHYDEPTEMPDIDNFDYVKERDYRDYTSSYRAGGGLNRKDVIKYLVGRSDGGLKSRYKHDADTENDEDANQRAEDYDAPALYDLDSIFGENKIVGGQEVDINLYPYHVAYGTNCGGAIIDKKWVITAGHCGKKPYVKVGSKYLNQGTKIMVKHSYIHPEWPAKKKEHPFDFDFQLLELAENLKFGDNIQPVKVAHIEDMVIGKVISVTGWGNTKENGPYSSVLRAVRVPIISKENCQHVPFPYFRGGLTARMFCAGFSEGRKDACQGDSGGPAVAYDRLLGMVSFGYGCATPGSYGVYSKVAKVRPWIEEVTGLKLD